MQIVYITTGLGTGGAERMLDNLLSQIDRKRFNPAVVSLLDRGTWGDRLATSGIPVYTIDMERGKPTPAALRRLMHVIRQVKPDLIQGWMYHGNLAAQIASLLFWQKIPVLWSIHNSADALLADNKMTGGVIKLGAWLSKLPTHVAFVSQTSKSQHQALGYWSENACVIPNGFDPAIFAPSPEARLAVRSELGLPNDCLAIGLICRYHPMKDHANFLQAAALLLKEYPDTHFILAGTEVDLQNHHLQQLVQQLKIENNIHMLGERQDMPRLMAALDISTLASAYGEAFPMAVGEAMSCGVPCVVTDVGDSSWLVGDTGKVVPPKNPQALANGWKELIEIGNEQRQALGKAARLRIIDCFALEKIAAQYEKLYESVLLDK